MPDLIPRAVMRKVSGGLYAFDIVADLPNGRSKRIKYGPIIVLDGIASS